MDGQSIHILLIEDNPGDARLLQELMTEASSVRLRLTHVDRLSMGLERLAQGGIDAALLDLSLPDSQGPDTLTQLQRHAPDVPVVVLTGLDDEALGFTLVQAGAQDYLVKGQVTGPLLTRSVRYAIERKRTEEVLRRNEEQLRQSQKMEAIGRLASGIAHDFNNLLTVINGYCEWLLHHQIDDTEVWQQYVEEIEHAGRRATALTRQLLTFSRKQVVQPEVLDLNAIVTNMNQMLQRLIGENIDLSTVLKEELSWLKADPGQLEQIIMNLVLNARDAMPQGGKLTIETAEVELDELYTREHAEVKPGPYIMLAVSDTGTGMTPETLSHIYEPFFTTKEPGQGTGLGLATVFGIVKQSGGHIWVSSEVGQGTTFKIYLPWVVKETEPTKLSPTLTGPAQGSETIMLVEDADGVRELLRNFLRNEGYTILTASNGVEALRLCAQYTEPLHMLVSDVVMPGGLNGRELAERLSLVHPEAKVLYISGYTDQAIVHHGVLAQDMAFLQKPFTPAVLIRKMREIFDASTG
jgi:signal transduction histidine kinase